MIGTQRNIHIFVLQEVRWPGTHDFIISEKGRFIPIGEKSSFAGVAFRIAPDVEASILGYKLLTDRVASLLLRGIVGPALLINHHAQHEDAGLDDIRAHWRLVDRIYNYSTEAFLKYVIGDCDMRLHTRLAHEHTWLGPHVVGRGA